MIDGFQTYFQLAIRGGIAEGAGNVEQAARKVLPVAGVQRLAREACDAVSGALADVLIGIGAGLAFFGGRQAEADDGEMRGEDTINVEVVDRREELAPGQVAVAAED